VHALGYAVEAEFLGEPRDGTDFIETLQHVVVTRILRANHQAEFEIAVRRFHGQSTRLYKRLMTPGLYTTMALASSPVGASAARE
jgi:hypothetical protein